MEKKKNSIETLPLWLFDFVLIALQCWAVVKGLPGCSQQWTYAVISVENSVSDKICDKMLIKYQNTHRLRLNSYFPSFNITDSSVLQSFKWMKCDSLQKRMWTVLNRFSYHFHVTRFFHAEIRQRWVLNETEEKSIFNVLMIHLNFWLPHSLFPFSDFPIETPCSQELHTCLPVFCPEK